MNAAGFLTPGFVIAGLEACWLYALLHLLRGKIGPAVPGAGILGLYVISCAYHLWAPWLQGRRFLREVTGWLLGAVLLFAWTAFTYPSPGEGAVSTIYSLIVSHFRQGGAFILGVGGAFWFMGRRLGRLRPDFALCLGEFQFGLTLLVIIYYLDAQFGIPLAPLVPMTIFFFLLGLTGLSITQVKKISAGVSRRSRLGLLSASLGFIFLIALWIFFVMKPELLAWMLGLLTAAARLIGHALFLLGSRLIDLIVMIGEPLVRFLAWLLHFFSWLVPDPDKPVVSPGGKMPSKKDTLDAVHLIVVPDWVKVTLKILVIAGLLALFVFLLWLASNAILKWLRRPKVFSPGAESQALPGAFRLDLLRLLGAVRDRILALIRGVRLRSGRIVLDPGTAGARQAYMRLLAFGAAGGCARRVAGTPDEHLEALTAWLPEAQGELVFLTRHYVRARYGPGPADGGTLKELVLNLRQVRCLGRRKKRQRWRQKFRFVVSQLAMGVAKGADWISKRPHAKV